MEYEFIAENSPYDFNKELKRLGKEGFTISPVQGKYREGSKNFYVIMEKKKQQGVV